MRRLFIIFSISVAASALVLVSRAYAFGFSDIIGTATTVINALKSAGEISDTAPNTFPFGGKITSSGTACKVRFWIWQIFYGFPIPCPNCGYVPIAGTVIDVGPPGVPASEVFTFPGFTSIYANKNEGKVGTWTLGIALKTSIVTKIIDKVNIALSKIPQIPVPNGWLDHFKIDCPSGGIITKIGTSQRP